MVEVENSKSWCSTKPENATWIKIIKSVHIWHACPCLWQIFFAWIPEQFLHSMNENQSACNLPTCSRSIIFQKNNNNILSHFLTLEVDTGYIWTQISVQLENNGFTRRAPIWSGRQVESSIEETGSRAPDRRRPQSKLLISWQGWEPSSQTWTAVAVMKHLVSNKHGICESVWHQSNFHFIHSSQQDLYFLHFSPWSSPAPHRSKEPKTRCEKAASTTASA